MHTLIKKLIVINMEKINMPPRPPKCRDLLPFRSINGIDTKVMATITAPTPKVAYLERSSGIPVSMKS